MASGVTYDLRCAGRALLRRPGFTVLAVLILGLGIGSVTVVFSAMHAVVLQPLPFSAPDRLVWVWSTTNTGSVNSTSAEDFYDYRERCGAFADLGARSVWRPGRIVMSNDRAERILTTTVSASFFTTLGVPPAAGRVFVPAEELSGGPQVVVVSHRYWQTRLAGEASAVGEVLSIDGGSYGLIGVMPASFDYPKDVDMWFPMQRGGALESGRGNNNFVMIGRLADGLTIEEAQTRIDVVAAAIAGEHPDFKKGWGARLLPLHERFVGDVRPMMTLLMGAVAAVLLIVCANLSSLLLAKAISRSRELAVRSSIGASRWVVGRQLLLESMLLACVGAAVGLALAVLSVRLLATYGELAPRLERIEINSTVVLVAVLATLASGLLAGLVPALHGTRMSLVEALKNGQHGTEGVRGLRLRSLLVVGQVALSVVLLVGAGLLVRSLVRLNGVDPGMEVDGVLTVDVQLPAARYADGDEETAGVVAELLDGVRSLPGVHSAAAADQLPLFGGPYNGLYPAERPPASPEDRIPATRRIISEDFFATLAVPLLQGRVFDSSDRADSQPVTVISQALAQTAFPDGEVLDRTLVLSWGDGIPLKVIGVVGDVRDFGLAEDFRPAFYMASRQFPDNDFRLVVKTDLSPSSLVPAIRNRAAEVDKRCAIFNVGNMEHWLAESMAGPRFTAGLLAVFALIALILSATGLYGVMAFIVAQRTREVGIRVALGAGPRQIIRRFLCIGLKTAGAGLAVGLLISPLATGVLRSVLFATDAVDPLTYLLVSVVLLLVVLAASVVPAARALRIDPASALRSE